MNNAVPASHTARTTTTPLSQGTKQNRQKAATKHEDDSKGDSSRPKRSRVSPASRFSREGRSLRNEVSPLAATRASKPSQTQHIISKAPTGRLNLYVFGSGENEELGLGTDRHSTDVSRPRLNPSLLAASVGVVHVATGGMHCAALIYDNWIITWSVDDQGALGRDTAWDGGIIDNIDGNKSDTDQASQLSGSDTGLNPREATPYPVDPLNFPEGTVFTQFAAGDSSTSALTSTGLIYGWGTFRVCSPCTMSPTVLIHKQGTRRYHRSYTQSCRTAAASPSVPPSEDYQDCSRLQSRSRARLRWSNFLLGRRRKL